MDRSMVAALALVAMSGIAGIGSAAPVPVTGNPAADGWNAMGNSLQNGVYAVGTANYSFQTYGAGFPISGGSVLEISDPPNSWMAGDNVVAVGGVFEPITAAAAGWDAFTGGAVNALLPAGQNPSSLKLQVKFGTNLATWVASTSAPNSGNGTSSSSLGGGRVQVRTSGYFGATLLTGGQDEPWTWAGNSGQLLVLDKNTHIDWAGETLPNKYAARMIWVYDAGSGHVSSWELLLNTSLLMRQVPTHTGPIPSMGDKAIMTVQQADGAYTDAIVNTNFVPVELSRFTIE